MHDNRSESRAAAAPADAPSAYLLDLDGTLYVAGAAIPGAVETLDRLRRAGTPFRLVTNTTSRSRAMIVDRLALDAGPLVAALEYATGATAVIAGKPSPGFFAAAVRSLGAGDGERIAMVGDDLWSDVEGAQRAGLQGWLVRTGKFRDEVLR